MHRFELIRKWGRMPEILKTGSPKEEDESAQGPEAKETFIYSMRRLAKPNVREIANQLLSVCPKIPTSSMSVVVPALTPRPSWKARSGDGLRPPRGSRPNEGTLG